MKIKTKNDFSLRFTETPICRTIMPGLFVDFRIIFSVRFITVRRKSQTRLFAFTRFRCLWEYRARSTSICELFGDRDIIAVYYVVVRARIFSGRTMNINSVQTVMHVIPGDAERHSEISGGI